MDQLDLHIGATGWDYVRRLLAACMAAVRRAEELGLLSRTRNR